MIPGTLLADDLIGGYLVEDPLGKNQTAETYAVLHVQLETRRVLNVILPELYQHDPAFREHFLQDMAPKSQLQHRNLRNICGIGWDEARDLLYYVTAFPEGTPLTQWLAAGKAIPEKTALKIIRELAEVLKDLAQTGCRGHWNVAPENIYLENNELRMIGEPCLTLPGPDRSREQNFRNPHFSAPELLADPEKADLRADLYSLGAVWFAMLAGQGDFDRKNVDGLDKYGLEISAPAKQLLFRLLDPLPEKRPASPAELLAELDRLPDGLALGNQDLQELTLKTVEQTVGERVRHLAADLQKQRKREKMIWKGGIISLAVLLLLSCLLTLFAGCNALSEKRRIRQTADELDALEQEWTQLQKQEESLKKTAQSAGKVQAEP